MKIFPQHIQLRIAILIVTTLLIFLGKFALGGFLGLVLLLLLLSLYGAVLGPIVLPRGDRMSQLLVGSFIFISLASIFGALIYYVAPVTPLVLHFLFFLFAISTLFLPLGLAGEKNDAPTSNRLLQGVLILSFAVLIASWWSVIWATTITESVRSLWLVLSPQTLLVLGLAVFTLWVLAHFVKKGLLVLGMSVLLFTIFILPAIVFPLGFGFDPFIHRATISHIAEFGTITPKPLYYIGQYALELIGFHIFSFPIHLIDRFLLPLLAAILLPAFALIGFRPLLGTRSSYALFSLLLIPLAAFTLTTPQSLAFLFIAALLFLSLPNLRDPDTGTPLATLSIITLSALLTHPLAGLPALFYLAFLFADRFLHVRRRLTFVFLSIFSILAVPLAFILQSTLSGQDLRISALPLFNFSHISAPNISLQYDVLLNAAYLLLQNQYWILLIFALIGFFYLKREGANLRMHLPFFLALFWLLDYWILNQAFSFDFLITYEQSNYADRFLFLFALFLLPNIGVALAGLVKSLTNHATSLRLGFALLLIVMITANFYGTYPRHDNYARSSGFNVSSADLDAVYTINALGEGKEYIVLANQSLSSAALEVFGFLRYYDDDIFYYPIPTGGELYQSYLKMTEDAPLHRTALEAMDLAGVDHVFFVVNDYWWNADAIIEEAKLESHAWFMNGDSVYVFIYDRLNPPEQP
jgi:hypothetical protein